MYTSMRIQISEHSSLYGYFAGNAFLAKCLYNAALFRIRQIFTGWEKQSRTENEKEVFDEVGLLQQEYPEIQVRKVISYYHLEKLMRVTQNPDFFAGLPSQTAQQILKQACQDFKNWLASLNAYKKQPELFSGKPKMPKYKKIPQASFTITNQDAILRQDNAGYRLKLPRTKDALLTSYLPVGISPKDLKEVKVKPAYGKFIVSLVFENVDVCLLSGQPETAAIDV